MHSCGIKHIILLSNHPHHHLQNFLNSPNWNSVPVKHWLPIRSPNPWPHHLLPVSVNLTPLGILREWNHIICLFVSGLYHWASCSQVHPHCSRCQNLLPFEGSVIIHCVDGQFVYPFIYQRTLGLFPSFGYCELCCSEHGGTNSSMKLLSNLLGKYPEVELLGHMVVSFCLFMQFMGFSQQIYQGGLRFPPPMDHVLSGTLTMTRPSWVALHNMAHSFTELCKPLHHNKAVIREGDKASPSQQTWTWANSGRWWGTYVVQSMGLQRVGHNLAVEQQQQQQQMVVLFLISWGICIPFSISINSAQGFQFLSVTCYFVFFISF